MVAHHKRNKPPNKDRSGISRTGKNKSIWKSVGDKCLQSSEREGEDKQQQHCLQAESTVLSEARGEGRAQLWGSMLDEKRSLVWPECTACFQRMKYPHQEMLLFMQVTSGIMLNHIWFSGLFPQARKIALTRIKRQSNLL